MLLWVYTCTRCNHSKIINPFVMASKHINPDILSRSTYDNISADKGGSWGWNLRKDQDGDVHIIKATLICFLILIHSFGGLRESRRHHHQHQLNLSSSSAQFLNGNGVVQQVHHYSKLVYPSLWIGVCVD